MKLCCMIHKDYTCQKCMEAICHSCAMENHTTNDGRPYHKDCYTPPDPCQSEDCEKEKGDLPSDWIWRE